MARIIQIKSLDQLGELVRATRKHQGLRQDEVGRFSHSFTGEVEKGKPTAQAGKLLELLRELGIRVHLELPADVEPAAAPAPAKSRPRKP